MKPVRHAPHDYLPCGSRMLRYRSTGACASPRTTTVPKRPTTGSEPRGTRAVTAALMIASGVGAGEAQAHRSTRSGLFASEGARRGCVGCRGVGGLYRRAHRVAGCLLSVDLGQLDTREQRHQEHQRNEHAREQQQAGYQALARLRCEPACECAGSWPAFILGIALDGHARVRGDRRQHQVEPGKMCGAEPWTTIVMAVDELRPEG